MLVAMNVGSRSPGAGAGGGGGDGSDGSGAGGGPSADDPPLHGVVEVVTSAANNNNNVHNPTIIAIDRGDGGGEGPAIAQLSHHPAPRDESVAPRCALRLCTVVGCGALLLLLAF
mmetsp:Transcript_30639/g.76198  ORF Transcript_30639/g.76198 Transcript_30639/m.76198 type:complete len:115 (+) Transcript_30639:2280-2624(+)